MTEKLTTPITPMLLETKAAIPKLAMRPREAAKAIGLSERTLWTLTNQGKIPHIRLGRAVLYPVDTLCEWLAEGSRIGGGE